jgi:hypothetical protein
MGAATTAEHFVPVRTGPAETDAPGAPMSAFIGADRRAAVGRADDVADEEILPPDRIAITSPS